MKQLVLIALIALTAPAARAADTAENPRMKGGLDKGVIDEQLKRHMPQIRACYERQLSAHPKAAGKIGTHFTIGAAGKVSKAEIITNTFAGPDKAAGDKVGACVKGVLEHVAFPLPAGGGTVDVDYPFSFAPAPASPPASAEAPGK